MKQFKRVLAIIMLIAIVSTLFAAAAFAINLDVKTTGKTNLRTGPGLKYKSKKTLAKGKTVSIVDYQFDNRNVVWYELDNGLWISGRQIKAGTLDDYSDVCSEHGKSFIRKSANKSSKSLSTVQKGDTVTFLNKTSVDSRGMIWYKVTDGKYTGWISARYCEIY